MGEVVVPIADLALGDNTDGWYELQQPKSQSEGVWIAYVRDDSQPASSAH